MRYNKNSIYAAACIGMAFFGIAFIVMGSVLPALTEKYDLDAIGASSLVTFLPVGVLLGSLIFGPIVDRFGYKNLLVISTLITSLGLEGLSYLEDLDMLRFAIFMVGFGGGILNGETNALVSDIYDGKSRNSRLSFLGIFYGLGALIIPSLLSILSKYYTYEIILRWISIIMALCILYFTLIRFPKAKHSQGFPLKHALNLIKQPALLLFSFVLFFQSGIEGLCNNWSTSFLGQTTTISPENTLFTLTFFILGMVASRLIITYLLHYIKPNIILFTGNFIALSGSILFYYSNTFPIAATALFLIGFGLSGFFPIVLGYIGSLYKEMAGTAIGFALFIALTGNSLLNYLMGFIAEQLGISIFPLFISINIIMQALILLIASKNIHKSIKMN